MEGSNQIRAVALLGNTGHGKTTLANKLSHRLKLPLAKGSAKMLLSSAHGESGTHRVEVHMLMRQNDGTSSNTSGVKCPDSPDGVYTETCHGASRRSSITSPFSGHVSSTVTPSLVEIRPRNTLRITKSRSCTGQLFMRPQNKVMMVERATTICIPYSFPDEDRVGGTLNGENGTVTYAAAGEGHEEADGSDDDVTSSSSSHPEQQAAESSSALVYLLDTPGRSCLAADAAAALRLSDGALIVVDFFSRMSHAHMCHGTASFGRASATSPVYQWHGLLLCRPPDDCRQS